MSYHMKQYCFLVLVLSVIHYNGIHCYNTSEISGNQREILIDHFQKILMNDSEQLFTLQKAFLLPQQDSGRCLNIAIDLGETDFKRKYFFEFLPAPTNNLVEFLRSHFIVQALGALDPFFHLLINLISNDYVLILYLDPSYNVDSVMYNMYNIDMTVGNIDLPDPSPGKLDIDVTDALYVTLSWARAYIENPKLNKSEDVSWIKVIRDCSGTMTQNSASFLGNYVFTSSTTAKLIFCTYIFVNILILLFTILYFGKIFSWIEQPQYTKLKELLKASAIVLTVVNLGTFLIDVAIHTTYSQAYNIDYLRPLDGLDYGIYLIVKVVLVFLIFIVEIAVSSFNACKQRPGCSSAMYAFGICQITWFLHRLATDTILFVIAFTVAPVQTLGMVTLLLSTIVCAILFVSVLLKKCETGFKCKNCKPVCNRNIFPSICCIFLIAICTLGLISTVTLLFIALVDNGLQSAGIGGFILSLVPPTAVFVIGLCINREFAINFYHNVLTSSGTVTRSAPADENVSTQTDEYTQPAQTSVTIEDMEGYETYEK